MKKMSPLLAISFWSTLTAIYFLPNLIYLGVKYEVIHLTPPVSEILGVELELKDGWFPCYTEIRSIFKNDPKSARPIVFYYKNDWKHTWNSSIITVSKDPDIDAQGSVEQRVKKYCSHFHCDFTDELKPLGTYDPRYGLFILVNDEDGLNNIVSIKQNNPAVSASTLK